MVAKNFAALSGGSPSPVDDATSTTSGVFSADRPSHPSSLHDITYAKIGVHCLRLGFIA